MSIHMAWMTHRSMTADPSVKSQKLRAGTVRRIFSFAKPYQTSIIIFLITVVIDAVLVIATPLLLRQLIDKGVINSNRATIAATSKTLKNIGLYLPNLLQFYK